MKQIRTPFVVNRIVSILQLLGGSFLLLFFGILTIGGILFFDLSQLFILFLSIGFDALGVFLVLSAVKRMNRVDDFKKIVNAFSKNNAGTLDSLAAALNCTPEVAKKRIQIMILHNFFQNAYIDEVGNRLVIGAKKDTGAPEPIQQAELLTAVCKSCGGINKISGGTAAICEYCGSPVRI